MKNQTTTDTYGITRRGATHENNHDHFAIASLNKSLRLHHSNLPVEEDRVYGERQGQLFLVADGISGGPAPAQASGTAIDSIVQYFLNDMPWHHFAGEEPDVVTCALEDALENAQAEIQRRSNKDRKGMGSTLTLALVFWPDLYVAHVGDSRCYLHRGGELMQLTRDHTMDALHRRFGRRTGGRLRNLLWNALGGGSRSLTADVQHQRLQAGDTLMLVTDGVVSDRPHEDIASILDSPDTAEGICERLIEYRRADDQTAIVARFLPRLPAKQLSRSKIPVPNLSAENRLIRRRGVGGNSVSCETVRRSARFAFPKSS